jgi:hypothetical protein
MLAAFDRLGKKTLRTKRARARKSKSVSWEAARVQELRKPCGRQLAARHECGKCRHPVSEPMRACPWCGTDRGGRAVLDLLSVVHEKTAGDREFQPDTSTKTRENVDQSLWGFQATAFAVV